MSYYIAYGNWGVREKFINWNNPNEPPLDLPFKLPTTTIIKSRNPADDVKTKTIIKKLPMVNLNETEVRKEQFDIKNGWCYEIFHIFDDIYFIIGYCS